MTYHPASTHGAPPAKFPSSRPDRFAGWRLAEELETPMRDGIVLRADLYLPEGCERAPVILIRQPYGRATPSMAFRQTGSFWARKGYACVVQDVRGKFSSEGVFDPMVHEVEDGFDTVTWISRQPWCDGRVGMWGESYYGFTALAAAVAAPPALLCIAPGDIASDRHRIWFRQGAFLINPVGPWAIAMDAPEYAAVDRVDSWHLPLVEMARAAGHEGRYFRNLVEHADDPLWWAKRSIRDRLERIRIPVLLWSGWYDNYTSGLLDDFAALEHASPRPESVHLLIGPWDHESSSEHTDRAVCVKLPPTGAYRWDSYQGFFDRYLMGLDNGFGEAGKVAYFTIGADRWQERRELAAGGEPADTLLSQVRRRSLARGTDHRGVAGPLSLRSGRSRRRDRGPQLLGPLQRPGRSPRDRDAPRCALLYDGAPDAGLRADRPDHGGSPRRMSAADTDFTIALIDLFEDGTANQIQDGIIRAAYRDDPYRPTPLIPGQVYAYAIELAGTSYVVKAGHRLRVDISSSCFDRYDRNLNTGARFGHGVEIRVAEQAIHHSADHPSHILLPLMGANQ